MTDDADYAELLELDGEVLHDYLAEVIGWVQRWAPAPTRRVVDLGAGTGTGTLALAARFPEAEVCAVDSSADRLARIAAKDAALVTIEADLDDEWPAGDQIDVVWASLSLHHVRDPFALLARIRASLSDAGIFALVETDGPPRLLPDDLGVGRPGLEERCRAVIATGHAHDMPHLGADWAPRLAEAGFTVLEERVFDAAPPRPYTADVNRYARAYLQRIRAGVADRLEADDLAVLDALLAVDGAQSVLRRGDLDFRGSRTAWITRRENA
ncbi:methyltransferase [Jatrophihabitans sp.]|uniref:methyltransferase n=1 Tax=Jatrophihabitans sp. TaxID=1932789 RepID=UPI0030C75B46|nr:SAM-dependent methyltransferase [Jatrophihabitans sp.]